VNCAALAFALIRRKRLSGSVPRCFQDSWLFGKDYCVTGANEKINLAAVFRVRIPVIASVYAMAFGGAKQALPKCTTSPRGSETQSSFQFAELTKAMRHSR
jgi:hypothetical protein